MINRDINRLSVKFCENFKQEMDSILYARRFFNDIKISEYDYYLAKIKYYLRFGNSINDSRDLSIWHLMELKESKKPMFLFKKLTRY